MLAFWGLKMAANDRTHPVESITIFKTILVELVSGRDDIWLATLGLS